jgi:hypothetical protein
MEPTTSSSSSNMSSYFLLFPLSTLQFLPRLIKCGLLLLLFLALDTKILISSEVATSRRSPETLPSSFLPSSFDHHKLPPH